MVGSRTSEVSRLLPNAVSIYTCICIAVWLPNIYAETYVPHGIAGLDIYAFAKSASTLYF